MQINSLILYFYESTICLGILYLFYYVLLRKERIYSFNRIYLIGSLLFSSVLPFLNFSLSTLSGSNSILSEIILKAGNPVLLPEAKIIHEIQFFSVFSISWPDMLILIYFTGVIYFLSKFIIGITRIFLLFRKYEVRRYKGKSLIYIKNNSAPFSFFKLIFLNPSLIKTDQVERIINHETAHVEQFHTIDLLFIELLTSIIWINPIIWLIRRSLKETHEFLADREVTEHEDNLLEYQNLLLNLNINRTVFELTNYFNKSMLKRRIIMMTTDKSTKFAIFKLLMIVPTIILITWIFACSKMESEIAPEKKQDITNSESAEITFGEDSLPTSYKDVEVFFIVEEMPKFQGRELETFRDYIAENLEYPDFCAKNKITGKVYVQFMVDFNGEVSYVTVVRGVHPQLDAEAIRVVKSSPAWEPGKQNGKNVNILFTFPINFVLN